MIKLLFQFYIWVAADFITKSIHTHTPFSQEEFDDAAAFGAEILSKKAGAEYPNGYLFVTMGAGDNWKVAQKIMAAGFLEGEK